MEAAYTSDYSYGQQDSFYDLNDYSFSPLLSEDQNNHNLHNIAPSTSLTPLWNSWNMFPPQESDGNISRRSDSLVSEGSDALLDLICTSGGKQQDEVRQSQQESGQYIEAQIQTVNPQQYYDHHEHQHSDVYQSCSNSTVQHQEEGDLEAFFDSSLPFDFETWNDLCTNDKHLTTTTDVLPTPPISHSRSNSISTTTSMAEHDPQTILSTKRKNSTASVSQPSTRKKRVVNKQNTGKKDLIASVIASLPVEVLEEQQRAIPTAFPSRMRQTRIQAAIKAQTDAMVQNCQQRIMKSEVNGGQGNTLTSHTSQGEEEGGVKYIGAYTLEERRLRIARFHEKRKERIWQHTVKYNCRRKLAVGRVRVKGRFVKCEE
jgi:hypothetical protein